MLEFRKAITEVVPVIGTIYRHYKGDHYMVTGLTRDSETKGIRISYQKPDDKLPWSRPMTGVDPDGKLCGWCDFALQNEGGVTRRFTMTSFRNFEEAARG